MFKLCANTHTTRTTAEIFGMFDKNADGVVCDDELSSANLNIFHRNAFGNDSIYRRNKYFSKISVENLRVALNRDKDKKGVIDINDFKIMSFNGIISENTFSLIELIAIGDTFGQYKDNLYRESGIKNPTFRKTNVEVAERQLREQTMFCELFYNRKIKSPLPINPY